MAGSNLTRDYTPTDEELIARVLAGDETSYGTLVARYQDYVYTIAVRIVGSDEDVEDMRTVGDVERYVQSHAASPA